MSLVIDTNTLATYDSQGVAPFINDFTVKRLTSTVSGREVSFTDNSITDTAAIDGPYIADILVGVIAVEVTGTTVKYTLSSRDANGKTAYAWVRYAPSVSSGS